MSRTAITTFAVTMLTSVATVVYVHNMQAEEREALHQGPIRDQERMRLKREAQKEGQIPLTHVQQARLSEYELQKKLRDEYSSAQAVPAPPTRPEEAR